MSKSIVYGDDGSGTNWPVPNENVSNLRRTLRSNKPEVHFHLGSELETSPVSFETKHSIEPRLSLVDRQLIAEAEDLNQSVQISFDQGNTDHILDDLAAVTESDNDVELNDNGDQNVLNNEISDGVNDEVNMAEERTLLPNPFRGAPDEDASEFWRRLENYCTYKGHDAANKLCLAKAMLVESSCDWLENLPDEKKNSFQNLETAFKERYVKPSILRYRSAREIFDRKQAPDESVESHVNRLQSLNKKVDVGQETLLYAFLSGLKPPIASFVMGKNPANFPEAVDAARIAEFSTVEGSSKSDQQLFDQMSEVRRDIQRLAQRYDSMSLTASVQSDGDKRTPERKVTFQEPRQRSVSPKPNMFVPRTPMFRGQPFQAQGPRYGAQAFRGRGRNIRGSRQMRMEGPAFGQTQSQFQTGGQKCHKCGRSAHANVMYCPAVNKQCSCCGKYGHFRAVCRLMKSD